ncbi:MAG: hypothetical protein L0H38_00315 [bacterium]|nr:hypothetical protein [bacterium]
MHAANNGYDTVAYMFEDGTVRREPQTRVKPDPNYDMRLGFLLMNRGPISFWYELNQYVSIGGPKKIVKSASGKYFIDGAVVSKRRVSQFRDNDLRDHLLEQMDEEHVEFVIKVKDSWSTFDHVHDRVISAW